MGSNTGWQRSTEILRLETFEKLASGRCEAHVRRGNLFDNQWLMRLLRFTRNDKGLIFQSSRLIDNFVFYWKKSESYRQSYVISTEGRYLIL